MTGHRPEVIAYIIIAALMNAAVAVIVIREKRADRRAARAEAGQ